MGLDRRLAGAVALAAASSTLLSAAAAAGPTSEPPVTEPAGSNAGPPAGEGFSVLGALGEIPAEFADDAQFLSVGDVDAATEAAGLERPDTVDDIAPWLMALTGLSTSDPREDPHYAPIPVVPPANLVINGAFSDEIEELVGFSFLDVSWFADASDPPSAFSVLAGDFDESTLADDLVDLGGGVVSLGDGDDFHVDADAGNALSRIGVSQRLAAADGRIALSPSTPLVREWVAGDMATAADDPELAAIAEALDAAGVSSAFFAELVDLDDAVGRLSPEHRDAIVAEAASTVLGDDFDEVGVGWSAVDGGSVITFVYHLDDDADPDAAAAQVRTMFEAGRSLQSGRPISDLVVFDDVATDGALVIVTMHPAADRPPWSPVRMFEVSDLPFVALD